MYTTASYVAIIIAVFGICRTNCVASPLFRSEQKWEIHLKV